MTQKKSIDAIIIAKNEKERIAACVDAVSWTDQTYVIDTGSTDGTADIARRCGASVIEFLSEDFSQIRITGAKKAKSEWLLYIDADETVTPDLRDEIQKLLSGEPEHTAYFLTRKNYYLGYPWPHRDGMVRLIKKDALIRWEGSLHEHAIVKGSTGSLRNPVLHDTHRTLEEMVEKTNRWSATEAYLRFSQNHPPVVWWRLLRVMLTGFYESYIKQNGWKAGTAGWIESLFQAFSMFVTYAKLWELQQKKTKT